MRKNGIRWVATAVALLITVAVAGGSDAQAKKRIVLAGSSAGGTATLFMATIAPLINKEVPTVEASARSGGTTQNVPEVERGDVDLAATNRGAIVQLYGKEGLAKTRVRTVWAMFHAPYHIVVPKDSPVKRLQDLEGKRLAIGTKGGGEGVAFQRLVESNGMKLSDFRVEWLGKAEAINAYKDGVVDAWAFLCPLPCGRNIIELAAHPRGAKFVSLSQQEVDKMVEAYPQHSAFTIPPEAYEKVVPGTPAMPSFTEWYYVVARDDFPEDVAYQIAKTLDGHHGDIVQTIKLATDSTAENTAKYPGFKLHPGSERYLKEKGLLK